MTSAATGVIEESFYEARRRHRRVGWRFSALTLVGVIVTGLPVALVVSPPFAALVLVVTDLVSVVLPMPDLTADVANVVAHVIPEGGSWAEPARPLTVEQIFGVACLALVPGLVVVIAAWLAVRRLFLRSGAEAVVLAAGARPPRADDVEEQQLVNLVEETAIAAGVPPPRVRILESDLANAAIVGRSVDDAIVVVPRHLLDQLGRRPTGALVADLVASAVNGDLGIALSIVATAQTIDLLSGALAAPTNARARQALGTFVRLARRRDRGDGDGDDLDIDVERMREARFIADELVALAHLEDVADVNDKANGGWRQVVAFPVVIARTALVLLRLIVVWLLVAPAMAMLWRKRRLLADATAVELTRDPDALIEALEYLQAHGASVPAGPWSHLFVVGPELEKDRRQRAYEEQHEAASQESRRTGESPMAAFARRRRARRAAQAEYMRGADNPAATTSASVLSGDTNLVAFLPPVEQRLQQLVAMGGTRATAPYRRTPLRERTRLWPLAYGAIIFVLAPLLTVLAGLLLVVSLAMAGLAAAVELAVLAPVVAFVHFLVG